MIKINSLPVSLIVSDYQEIIKNAPPVKIKLPDISSVVADSQSNNNIDIHV